MDSKPSPIPRTQRVMITHHGRKRAAERGISEPQIKQTVVEGSEEKTGEVGEKGGPISKFRKTFVILTNQSPSSIRVVAVCEVFADRFVLLTCYRE